MSPVTRRLMQRFRACQISRLTREAYLGEKFVLTHVLYGTYIARPGVHSEGYGVKNPGIWAWEEYVMLHIDRYISSLFLAAAIAAPTAIMAHSRPQDSGVQVRVYDRDHRDYHNWDDHEDRAYRRYLTVQHRSYRQYHRQHYRVQKHYWNWRHSHPDRD
jgi:hypothetical protein